MQFFFLNLFLYIEFENICYVICSAYGSNMLCVEKCWSLCFCYDISYGDIMFCE